jgi:hypothetical protein
MFERNLGASRPPKRYRYFRLTAPHPYHIFQSIGETLNRVE